MSDQDNDGHEWVKTWGTLDGARQADKCVSKHDCGVQRFRDGESMSLGAHAPWVAPEHVELHAKASVRR